ncbi:Short-chain dehydrogenase/reductase SDR OS=Tsukamurella paurometabola (strain ATCC 8368 / DSM/ CCUG 35730 / CIP 100753 / JCM 10117 / KCTC 9821 / NBRC 16120/ NCIMB 702349 / NCTC 13040) OX=521096 GN=Tpau_4122 PE=3 SV=1 [Tsukamurella paurometabola]|uniref:Short-chain dehydrogenase/reductase SDR n=1 Tax=Tsukamurella paurometabola (strain ATCC 8368 / DSM 20162 / CCUG 35730 / CIP 100753 / JCM 10117 / KCTC 9821 / NBRC 16120 / NCIMB 702349 / NCTC 13040) TaxID=521096 RepID=D5UNY2_TSUPD|nr:SDR family NAD(P)-dependent oxidoreductase [Tsukamurella paurometabola]ADG80691.1 short-chain dehydrogenase/reductase SDR [Tsukamurella paurometabola DSM 20162]SUP40590.1 Fatty acyl-CoA reductase [Tsukamurella paurometabola]
MSVRRSVQEFLQRRSLLPGAIDAALSGPGRSLRGLRIVVTGASSGIGREAAIQLAERGAHVIAVARREPELEQLCAITGGEYRVCDLTDTASIDGLLAELGDVDVLINNAGHSIRRSIADSTDRLHDFQRTMNLNYFAAVHLALGVLPGMIERGRGQIVNVCTWGLLANTFPRFSAYGASKSALAIFGRSLNAERPHPGVHATNVYFPLVRTEMIAPTEEYEAVGALEPDEAGRWIVRAVTHQPIEVSPAALRAVLPVVDLLSPSASDRTISSLT